MLCCDPAFQMELPSSWITYWYSQHSDGWVGLYIYDSAYLTVKGLTFLGADGWEEMGDYGVYIEDSSNVTLSGLDVGQFASTLLAIGGIDADAVLSESLASAPGCPHDWT